MEFFKKIRLAKVKKQAVLNGLYFSQGTHTCIDCIQAEATTNCITGLKCTLRIYDNGKFLVVPDDYICSAFELQLG